MKAITYTIAMMLLTVSMAAAAGSPSAKPSVAKDVQDFNAGVKLMLDKKFSSSRKAVSQGP
jgi:hypothetical protein